MVVPHRRALPGSLHLFADREGSSAEGEYHLLDPVG